MWLQPLPQLPNKHMYSVYEVRTYEHQMVGGYKPDLTDKRRPTQCKLCQVDSPSLFACEANSIFDLIVDCCHWGSLSSHCIDVGLDLIKVEGGF
jgi:hypothetical protein